MEEVKRNTDTPKNGVQVLHTELNSAVHQTPPPPRLQLQLILQGIIIAHAGCGQNFGS